MKLVQNPDYPELVCVRAVRPLRDLRVHLTCTDNSEREIDLEPYLHGPIFDPIRNDPRLFAQVYVDPETETLTCPTAQTSRQRRFITMATRRGSSARDRSGYPENRFAKDEHARSREFELNIE